MVSGGFDDLASFRLRADPRSVPPMARMRVTITRQRPQGPGTPLIAERAPRLGAAGYGAHNSPTVVVALCHAPGQTVTQARNHS